VRIIQEARLRQSALGGVLLLLVFMTPTSRPIAQAIQVQYNEVGREYERGARKIWSQQQVLMDSQSKKLDELYDIWKAKIEALHASSKDVNGVGRYGDSTALGKEPLVPWKVASGKVTELESAVRVREQELERIRQGRASDPNALDLYRDEVHAVVAVNSLTSMLYNERKTITVYKMIELYLRLRLEVASSVSTELYAAELKNGKEVLADLYEKETKSQASHSEMMNFFLTY
jgi:hypothetical protein